MPTEEELSANKKLINVSNLVQYTKGLKNYLDVSLSKKQDVLENGENIAVLIINNNGFPLIGNSSTIDLTDSIAKTITRNFLRISNSNNATDFTNATIKFPEDISNAFENGIKQYIGISWKKYNAILKESTPVYLYFVGVEKNAQYTDFHFISFDGIYTITISGTDNHITKKSF